MQHTFNSFVILNFASKQNLHLIKEIPNTKKEFHWKGYGANQMFKSMLIFWFQ